MRDAEPSVTSVARSRATLATTAFETSAKRGAPVNLIANGGFSAQPNPLAFWTNAPGAFVTWLADGANGSQGSAHVRFLPPVSRGVAKRGAIYYTGLTQCVSIPGPGRYLLEGFARVPETANASSAAGVDWTIRYNSANCSGPHEGNGGADFPRSSTWTRSFPSSILVDSSNWTPATTILIEVQVGDSSTGSIEAVEAVLDEISLVEGPLFADGFED